MKIYTLKRPSLPKIAVLVTGLTAAILVATITPQAAHATPRAGTCAGCHADGGGAFSTVTAVPSTATPLAGATYTVTIIMTENPTAGDTGYGIVALAPTPAPSPAVFGGMTGTSQLSYTADMIAPAAAGTYTYTVFTNQGPRAAGLTGSKQYSITVAAAPVAVTTTTSLAVAPTTAVAPASATLTATVTGTGAAGTVQFLNGATVLGTSTVAAGSATLALTGVAAGNYSYTANFIPTSSAAFTPSASTAASFVVTAPAPTAVTTTTALAVSPATAVAPASATLTATVTGTGAAGTVQFFNGATSLGTSTVAAGIATKALTGVAVGSYSYTAEFIPTDSELFTPSTSSAASFVVTAPVVSAPGVPTGVTAKPGSGQVVVSWNASAGATSYTVTASPGGRSVTTSGTTATVTGLTNGVSYTFTVTAANAAGTSAVSAASAAATPTAAAVPGVVPVGAPSTGAGGASQSGGSPLTGLGGLALLLAGAAMVPAIRRRRRA